VYGKIRHGRVFAQNRLFYIAEYAHKQTRIDGFVGFLGHVPARAIVDLCGNAWDYWQKWN
jgi:hypothetical protein